MKTCARIGCKNPASKRGITCGPACAHQYRYGLKEIAEPADSQAKSSEPKEKETHEQKGDSWAISIDATRIKSLEQLVEHCQIDLSAWEVERFVANKWEVGARDSSGNIQTSQLFQIKAWLKKKPGAAFAAAEIADLKEKAKHHSPKHLKIVRKDNPAGNVLEISLPDLHIGKMAWGKETGYSDYDVSIAVESFNNAMSAVINRVSSFDLDLILFVVGNDLFHVDTRSNTTTAGTVVDTDSRYHKTFKIVRDLMIKTVEQLRGIAPVRLVIVPGNHDEHSAWHLGDSLECWFHGCEDVSIDNAPTPRKYFKHGSVMLMFTHGHKAKQADYPLIMATEQPEMFGSTTWREAHVGHLHTTRTNEYHGVRVRILPSLCGTDYWHSASGFTGNIKSAEAFLWNDKEGLIATSVYRVPDSGKEKAS